MPRRRRRFSEQAFGPTVERLMDETGVTYRALAEKTKLSISSMATALCLPTTSSERWPRP